MAAAASTFAVTSNELEDRIGTLPDSILLVIISFLSTLDAVRTSVLSRRWRNLWKSVDILNFDESFLDERVRYRRLTKKRKGRAEEENLNFTEFVNKVLTLHHAQTLRKLRVSYSSSITHVVEDWVRLAVTREVKELELWLRLWSKPRLPPCLFVSHSLVDLKLTLWGSALQLPTTFSLPSLRSMYLRTVTFLNAHQTRDLFSSCTALRSLTMVNCRYGALDCLEISCPLLQSLTFKTLPFFQQPGLNHCRVKISAPQLTFFAYRSPPAQAYNIDCPLLNVEVRFPSMRFQENNQNLRDRVLGFLHLLSSARNLKICKLCVEALLSAKIPGSPVQLVVPFRLLNVLKLQVPARLDCTVFSLVLKFLIGSPGLKTLGIEFGNTNIESPDPDDEREREMVFRKCYSEQTTGDTNIESPDSDSDAERECENVIEDYSKQTTGILEEVDITYGCMTQKILHLVRTLLVTQAGLQRLLLSEQRLRSSAASSRQHRSNKLKALMQKITSFPRRSCNLSIIAFLE